MYATPVRGCTYDVIVSGLSTMGLSARTPQSEPQPPAADTHVKTRSRHSSNLWTATSNPLLTSKETRSSSTVTPSIHPPGGWAWTSMFSGADDAKTTTQIETVVPLWIHELLPSSVLVYISSISSFYLCSVCSLAVITFGGFSCYATLHHATTLRQGASVHTTRTTFVVFLHMS